jgi:transcriptional regulator with XRE-family HTH domain
VAREPDEIATMRLELGRQLAAFRKAAGLTQVDLAREAGSTRSSLVNIETGRQGTSSAVWERLDTLLDAKGVLVGQFDELAAAKAEWNRIGSVFDLVESTFGPEARVVPSGTVSDVRAVTVRWLVSDRHERSTSTDVRRTSTADIGRLQTARERFKAVDNEFGGAVALPLITEFVRTQVRPVLRGAYTDASGSALMGAAAHLVLDAGWAAYDANLQPFARRCMRAALRLADAAGDRLFGGRVLAALAHQSLHMGRRQEAVDLARAAIRGTGRVAGWRAVAMFEAMVACAAASVGDRTQCEAALARAERALDRAGPDSPLPGWLDFDRGGLAGHAARAYRDLGHGGRAQRFADEAIGLCHLQHHRTFVQRRAILASALASAGEIEEACAVGHELMIPAVSLRSALVVSDLTRLAAVIGPAGPGREFRQQVQRLEWTLRLSAAR